MSTAFKPENWSDNPLDQAIAWQVELGADNAGPEIQQAWQRWYDTSSQHQQAWHQVCALQQKIAGIPVAGKQALHQAELHSKRRRQLLQGALSLGLLAPAAWLLQRSTLWHRIHADHYSATGAISQIQLADGNQLSLNTDTAININRGAGQPEIELLHGELYLQSTSPGPVRIRTLQGIIHSQNATLNLRQFDDHHRVDLYSGQSDIRVSRSGKHRRLHARQSVYFDQQGFSQLAAANPDLSHWPQGMLIVQNWSLAEFCEEVERYLPGKVYCSEAISSMRISGTFPLAEPLQLLSDLHKVLPVKTRSVSEYWVLIEAA